MLLPSILRSLEVHIAIFLLKISNGAIKTVRNIDDLRTIGETMKLTYKTITMNNEDTDFQFYDRLLKRASNKILHRLGPPPAHRLSYAPDQHIVHGVGEANQVRKVPQHSDRRVL